MRVYFWILALFPVLLLGMIFLVAQAEAQRLANSGFLVFFGGLWLALVSLMLAASAWGNRIRQAYESSLRQALAGLELRYRYFGRRLYAFGKFKGYVISFNYGPAVQNDWAPPVPGIAKMLVRCRIKIPGTENLRIHLAVFPGNRNPSLRSLYGWTTPESRFSLAPPVTDESLRLFRLLSETTKCKLKMLTEQFGVSCGISPDWETVMIGKESALQLVDGSMVALSQLDLHAKLPFGVTARELTGFLDLMLETAESLAVEWHQPPSCDAILYLIGKEMTGKKL